MLMETVISCTRFETDQYDKVPFFMFGDYNFRLDTNQLVKVCTCFFLSAVVDYLTRVQSVNQSINKTTYIKMTS